jgi:hypothetical protein
MSGFNPKRVRVLFMVLALALAGGCGGGGGGGASAGAVEGVAMPNSVSVVSANNAN